VATLIELRRRIQAVENIQTITRTLATVAAAKLARARRRAAGLREYAGRIREILHAQQACLARTGHPAGAASALLREIAPVRGVTVLVLTGDRGMCGGYNLEACRVAAELWQRRRRAGQRVRLVVRGGKGAGFFRRRGAEIVHEESWPRQGIAADDVERLLDLLISPYRAGAVEEVWVAYTEFHSAIHRRPRVVRMLPVELPAMAAGGEEAIERWCYEPSAAAVVEELVATYLRVQLWDVLLESYASEQGARMITMDEATARADQTLQECRVQHHRLRREAITTDLVGSLFASQAVEGTLEPARPA
jgi:F-type H+-transporting ATPase subunit gamma